MSMKLRPPVIGVIASAALLMMFIGIVSFAESFEHALAQLREMWTWIALLVAGFGTQVGLYTYIRSALKALEISGATGSVATATGVSTTSMVACCAHHLTDVLAIIGLSALSAALAKYQTFFLIIGILSNLVGITIMLEVIQLHGLGGGLPPGLMRIDLSRTKKAAFIIAPLLLILSYFVLYGGSQPITNAPPALPATTNPKTIVLPKTLPSVVSTQDSIEFAVTPSLLEDGKVAFDIQITTHSGSLDFDLTTISILKDGNGNIYNPLSWEGSPPGGHHRSGVLTFSQIPQSHSINLVVSGVGSNDRVFTWNL